MVFKILMNLLVSSILVLRNFLLLIFSPYKTMRKIAQEKDYWQLAVIISFVLIYFEIANKIRRFNYSTLLIFIVFLSFFISTVFFFYLLGKVYNKKEELKSFFITFSYSLLPTLVWFITNSIIYYVLPPPRTMSLQGKGFSILFFAFSLSLFVWKIILVYLSVRFSAKLSFYKIIFLMILYLCLFFPISIFLYQLKVFRVPFI